MQYTLSSVERRLVLSACPAGTRIVDAVPVRDHLLPCPLRVRVAPPDGEEQRLILRLDRARLGVARETGLLPLLARHGLPVATVLAGPVYDPNQPTAGAMSVLSLLSGEDILSQGYACRARGDGPGLLHFEELVLEAVGRLHGLTNALRREGAALPERPLQVELAEVAASGAPWLRHPPACDALRRLGPLAEQAGAPLVFANGDFNPANFLSDGAVLTGFVDFAWACFEDPCFGIAKYANYAWLPFDREGMLRRFREARGFSERDLELRVAVACLWSLQHVPPADAGAAPLLRRLELALEVLE